MSKKQTIPPIRIKCNVDGMKWGEYLHEGDTYQIAPPANPKARRCTYYFRNERTGGGTFMSSWQFQRALKEGFISHVAAAEAA